MSTKQAHLLAELEKIQPATAGQLGAVLYPQHSHTIRTIMASSRIKRLARKKVVEFVGFGRASGRGGVAPATWRLSPK
jgi:hypothetical protein